MVTDLLAHPTAGRGLLELPQLRLVVHLDKDRLPGQDALVHQGAARSDAADRTVEHHTAFRVLDRVVRVLTLSLAAEHEAGVLVTHDQRDLLATLDHVGVAQVVQRASGRA